MITTTPIPNYRSDPFLKGAEGIRENPYFDTEGLATIGYGFNIETNADALKLVLNQLGVFDGQLDQNINKIVKDFTTAIQGVPNFNAIQLVNTLNAKLREYLGTDTTTLFMLNPTQAATVYDQILGEDPVTGVTTIGQNHEVEGKQKRLDNILQSSLPHDSKE